MEEYRRVSNVSLMMRTTSECQLNSVSSGIDTPMSSLSMLAISSKESLATHAINNRKSKNGIKKFFRKIFGSPSHDQGAASSLAKPLNVNLLRGTAYPSVGLYR